MTISLCMIVKNEEKLLNNFLRKINPFVDEIIIVDTGSKDKTKEISKKFTKNVYDFKWNNDFSKARNFSISKTTKKWILIMDIDEKVSYKDLKKLKDLTKTKEKSILGYRFIQKTKINGKTYIRGICRLFKNDKRIKFIYNVHETVKPNIEKLRGKIGKTGIIIIHKPKNIKNKSKYYLKLLKHKLEKHPNSSAKKEIMLEKEVLNAPGKI